jgi:hypothetical protein
VFVGIAIGVREGVNVSDGVVALLRKITMVCVEAFPSTIDTVALRPPASLLINRFAGIVYISVTEYPDRESSVIVNDPTSALIKPEQAPTGMVTDLPENRKVK